MKKFLFFFLILLYLCPLSSAEVNSQKIIKLVEELSNGSYLARKELLKIGAPAVPYLIEELILCDVSGLAYEGSWDSDYPPAALLRDLGVVSVPALVKTIRQNPNPKQACGAQLVLAGITDPKAVPQLLKLSDDSNPAVQNAAIKALGNIKDPKTIALLCDKLKQTSPLQAQTLILALANIHPEKSPAVLAMIKDQNPQNRIYGYTILFRSKSPEGQEIFLNSIKDSDLQVKRTCLDLLHTSDRFEINPEKVNAALRPLLKDPDWNFRRKGVKLLAQYNDLSGAATGLQDTDNQVRQAAASALEYKVSNDTSPEIINALIQAFKNEPKPLTYDGKPLAGQPQENAEPNYYSLVDGLRNIGESAVPALQKAAQDPDWHTRLYSLKALSEINKEENFPFLTSGAKDSNPKVRSTALWQIYDIKNSQVLTLLRDAVKDSSPEVRQTAIDLLGRGGYKQEFEVILPALKDPDPKVRDEAFQYFKYTKDSRAIPTMIGLLADSDDDMASDAMDYLTEQKDPKVVAALIPVLLYNTSDLRDSAVYYLSENWLQANETALEYLQTTDPKKIRAGAQLALTSKLKSAVPFLKNNLNIKDDEARLYVIGSLAVIEGQASRDILLEQLNDPNPEIRQAIILLLAKLTIKGAAPRIRPLLKDPNLGIRCYAILYLIAVKDPEGIKQIKKMSKDKNQPQEVKETINDALEAGGVPEPSIEIYAEEPKPETDW